MAFYIPNASKYRKKQDEEDDGDTSTGGPTSGKTSNGGFFTPSTAAYQKVYESQLEDEEKARQEQRSKDEAQKKELEAKNNWFNKGVEGVKKAFSVEGAKDVIGDVNNTLVKPVIDAGINAVKQAQMGAEGATDYRYEQLSKARDRFADEDFASGAISAERRDAIKAENQAKLDEAKKKTADIEAKSGRKYDQDQGAVDAIETLSMIDLPYALAKGGVKAGSSLLGKFGKKAAYDELEVTAKVIDDVAPETDLLPAQSAASKPEPKAADMAPIEVPPISKASERRAVNYTVDATKPRVSSQEATEKLQKAGYTTDESVAILSDALPDKGLSMPGSPKKIGYSEESILKAADDLDTSHSLVAEIPPTATPKVPVEGTSLAPLASIDGTAEKGTSKLASSVRQKAVDKKLISKTEAEVAGLPEYNKANMRQQAEYATGLIKSDPQAAVDIAMGRKAPPQHILPQMVYNAVEDHAMKIGGEKGGKLLKDLANSKRVSDLTVMAQNVRAAAERDPHSPVALINDLKLARAEAAKKRGKDAVKAEKADMKAIEKATPKVTKDDWDVFVKELEC